MESDVEQGKDLSLETSRDPTLFFLMASTCEQGFIMHISAQERGTCSLLSCKPKRRIYDAADLNLIAYIVGSPPPSVLFFFAGPCRESWLLHAICRNNSHGEITITNRKSSSVWIRVTFFYIPSSLKMRGWNLSGHSCKNNSDSLSPPPAAIIFGGGGCDDQTWYGAMVANSFFRKCFFQKKGRRIYFEMCWNVFDDMIQSHEKEEEKKLLPRA